MPQLPPSDPAAMLFAEEPPPLPPVSVSPYKREFPPLYFVVPNPADSLPFKSALVVVPPNPALARTPVVLEVGAVLLDVLELVFQFIQTSPPLPPLVLEAVAPVPPAPIDV
jgi:hypothetical protein